MSYATLILTAALAFSTGCSSSAALVRSGEYGGEVALKGPYMPAMTKARLLIAEYCNGRPALFEHARTVEFRCSAPSVATQWVTSLEQTRAR